MTTNKLRRLPVAFVIVAAVQLVMVSLRLGVIATNIPSWLGSMRFSLFAQGVSFATTALLVAAAFELARRTTGRASAAARVAGIVFAVGLALDAAFPVLMFLVDDHYGLTLELVLEIDAYLWSGVMIGGFVALLFAGGGWQRAPALASVALGAIAVSRAPPLIQTPLRAALGQAAGSYVFSLLWLVALGCTIAVLARAADHAEPAEDTALGERGLRMAANGLWLRVVAVGVLIGLGMMVHASRRSGGNHVLPLAIAAGRAVYVAGILIFAFGAFMTARSRLRDLSSLSLHIAGTLSLWVAGVLLAQLPALHGISRGRDLGADLAAERVKAFGLVLPLVGAAGLVMLGTAIAGFARKRELTELRHLASSRTGAFAVLILLNALFSTYALPQATTKGQFIAMSFSAAIASLVAIVMLAKLCALAADAVHQAPGLPTARLHEPH